MAPLLRPIHGQAPLRDVRFTIFQLLDNPMLVKRNPLKNGFHVKHN